jgi:DNA-binding beta-propeller fold protein YncE
MNQKVLATFLIIVGIFLAGALYYLTHVLPSPPLRGERVPITSTAPATTTPPTVLPGFNGPFGVALDSTGHRLFVADARNNRVLVFLLDADNNFATITPAYVLGQADFTSRRPATARNGMNYPHGVTFDATHERLFVTDTSNSRVLVFNVASGTIANGEGASYVLGQPNFIAIAARVARNRMSAPYNTAYDATYDRLFVADDGNNRVLIFNVSPIGIANGENADYVLGQSDFVSRHAATSQNGMNSANGLTYDQSGQRLFVADTSNDRVLIFNVAPGTVANGEGASYVLGQPDFISSAARAARDGMNYPYNASYDATDDILVVADSRNNRVLSFDVAAHAITNGENASRVFGQLDFTSHAPTTAISGFADPYGAAYDPASQNLFVADTGNNRVLAIRVISIAQ